MKYYQPTDMEVAVRMVAQALRYYKKKHKKLIEQLPKIKFGVVNETTVDYWCDLTREKYEEITQYEEKRNKKFEKMQNERTCKSVTCN